MFFQLIESLGKLIKDLLKLNTDFKTLLLDNTKNLDIVGILSQKFKLMK